MSFIRLTAKTYIEFFCLAKSNFEEFGSIIKDEEVDDNLMELIHGIQLYQNNSAIEAVRSFHKGKTFLFNFRSIDFIVVVWLLSHLN